MESYLVVLAVLFLVQAACSMPQGPASDPCQPNPCGDNSICKTSGDAGAIACYCEPGYDQIDPDDPWACVPDGSKGLAGGEANEPLDLDTVASTTTTTSTTPRPLTTTDRPSFLPPKERIIGKDQFGHTRIFVSAVSSFDTEEDDDESEAPSVDSNDVLDISSEDPPPSPQPRTPSVGQPSKAQEEHRLVGLTVDEIYNAECLINDDCDIDKFCDVTEKVCKDPCVFLENVCGERARCKVKIHRPLCYCPDGLVGNPHAECKTAPSRAGTRF